MPTPKKDQKKDDFMKECMSHDDTQKWDSSQRYAICLSMWNKHAAGSSEDLDEAIKEIIKNEKK